jgi:hypothetical protein
MKLSEVCAPIRGRKWKRIHGKKSLIMMSKVFKSYDLNWSLKPTVSLYETDMDRNLGMHIAF